MANKTFNVIVTVWLYLRNKTAHGDYTAYSTEQVQLLLTNVQDFITRHPAYGCCQ
ncbi:hypothetical protein Slin_6156 [Spirosoma linguale DSM 74]|uniref:Uncharacterized protein n=1 Tax=Spirosoma linguale (strain ATCC 33905 / DSM 74 / LMG 10896 / Claus 1) TaxID=504472 RepID=D2QTI4_SPILD|nr:hypothetical protein Slin_6156 [Spirosoma linguale DSM 74]